MKIRYFRGSILMSLCLLIFACSPKLAPAPADKNVVQTLPSGFKWHQESNPSYKIAYPENWTAIPKEELRLSGDLVGWAMFKEKAIGPSPSISLMLFSKYDMNALKNSSAKSISINGKDAYQTKVAMFGGKQDVVILEANGLFFVLQCTAPIDVYDTMKDVFEKSINSLTIN